MNRKNSSKQNVTFLSQFNGIYFFFITCFHFACHVVELHLVYRTTDVVLMLCILLLLLHHRLFQPRTRMALLKHLKLYVL